MTLEEYRDALNRLKDDEFSKFREQWGGTANTIDKKAA